MPLRPIIDCIIILLFSVAAGFNLWDIMLKEVHPKRVLIDAAIGLAVLVLWVSSEAKFLLG